MDDKSKAVFCMLGSCLFFSLMNVLIKFSSHIPTIERVFYSNVASLVITYFIIRKNSGKLLGSRKNNKHMFFRCMFGYFSLLCSFYAVSHLILADASMLSSTSPFFVTFFAAVFLKEKLRRTQIPVLIITFIGAMLVIKPEFTFDMVPCMAGIGAAFFGAVAYTIISFLKGKEENWSIVFCFSLFSAIASFPCLFAKHVPLGFKDVIFLSLMAVCWTGGQYFLTLAYKHAPAAEVSIYTYSGIIFATMFGFLIWNEVPDIFSVAGGMLIIISGAMNYIHGKRTVTENGILNEKCKNQHV